MTIFDEPKVDCHVHVFEPVRFPYGANTFYAPAGQEIGTASQLLAVLAAYGVGHALVVGPNSAYDTDNRLLLDLLGQTQGRLRGMAVVDQAISGDELDQLQAAGVVGVTMQLAYFGTGYATGDPNATEVLLARLAERDLWLDLQVEKDQLIDVLPMIEASDVRVVIDHCGRPDPVAGLGGPGFRALLRLGESGRATVKLSSLMKFSVQSYPYRDAWPFVAALIESFGPSACVWGSDWPFLRAPERIDYGPLLILAERLIPDAGVRREILWETPRRVFGFSSS